MTNQVLKEAVIEAEQALGENLVWLSDKLDIYIRQHDAETIRRLDQLNKAWIALCHAKVLSPYSERELIAPGKTAETEYRPLYEAIKAAAEASELLGEDELERFAAKATKEQT